MTSAFLSGGNVTQKTIAGIVRMSPRIAVSGQLGEGLRLGAGLKYHPCSSQENDSRTHRLE